MTTYSNRIPFLQQSSYRRILNLFMLVALNANLSRLVFQHLPSESISVLQEGFVNAVTSASHTRDKEEKPFIFANDLIEPVTQLIASISDLDDVIFDTDESSFFDLFYAAISAKQETDSLSAAILGTDAKHLGSLLEAVVGYGFYVNLENGFIINPAEAGELLEENFQIHRHDLARADPPIAFYNNGTFDNDLLDQGIYDVIFGDKTVFLDTKDKTHLEDAQLARKTFGSYFKNSYYAKRKWNALLKHISNHLFAKKDTRTLQKEVIYSRDYHMTVHSRQK